MPAKPLLHSMRFRTLPLSLSGVVCGAFAAVQHTEACQTAATLGSLLLTTVSLQILSNLSNEMGDHLSGVDSEQREGPNYGMDNGLTVSSMWKAINAFVIICCVAGLAMIYFSWHGFFNGIQPPLVTLLGAMAIWASTHYTLGKNPYGYKGLGDVFVLIFFGLVSVMGSYFVMAHTLEWEMLVPALGIGLLSVGVLNVNNIRDMQTDQGIRRTVPLRIGVRNARIYQTAIVSTGWLLMLLAHPTRPDTVSWWLTLLTLPLFAKHIHGVWCKDGRKLDPMLPLLVMSTFILSILYALGAYGL